MKCSPLSVTGPETSAGGGGESVREEMLYFSDKPLRHARPADFLSQTLSVFIQTPVCARYVHIRRYNMLSNYGINKALPPKADIKAGKEIA